MIGDRENKQRRASVSILVDDDEPLTTSRFFSKPTVPSSAKRKRGANEEVENLPVTPRVSRRVRSAPTAGPDKENEMPPPPDPVTQEEGYVSPAVSLRSSVVDVSSPIERLVTDSTTQGPSPRNRGGDNVSSPLVGITPRQTTWRVSAIKADDGSPTKAGGKVLYAQTSILVHSTPSPTKPPPYGVDLRGTFRDTNSDEADSSQEIEPGPNTPKQLREDDESQWEEGVDYEVDMDVAESEEMSLANAQKIMLGWRQQWSHQHRGSNPPSQLPFGLNLVRYDQVFSHPSIMLTLPLSLANRSVRTMTRSVVLTSLWPTRRPLCP